MHDNHDILTPIVRFSEFLGIAYFGDKKQHVIAPIFDLRRNAEHSWKKLMTMSRNEDKSRQQYQEQVERRGGEIPPLFDAVFVEHPAKYEFIAYPVVMKHDQMNYAIYRSFSSLTSLHKFKSNYDGKAFIKFGWYDVTKKEKFDVFDEYAIVNSVEFKDHKEIKPGMLIDHIRKS